MDSQKLHLLSDSVLIKEFQSKADKKFFEELYLRYKNMIYSYVRKFLYRTPEDIAKEIVQEVFIKVYLELNTLRTPEAFRSWLYKIARNFCLKHIRSNKGVNISLDDCNSLLGLNIIDSRVNIEEESVNNKIREVVFNEIKKLDDKLRDVIFLKFFDRFLIFESS